MRVAIDLADQHQEPPTAKQFIRGHSRSASKITLKVSASRADMIYVPPEDRRAEPRNKSRGRFQLLVDGAEPLATTAYNTSPSGICLEAFAPVETGTAVRVDGEGFIAHGVVRYCNNHRGAYRIGISFVPVESETVEFR